MQPRDPERVRACDPGRPPCGVECILRADDRRRWERRAAEDAARLSDHDALMAEVARARAACSAYWMQDADETSWLDAPELAAGGRADEAIAWGLDTADSAP